MSANEITIYTDYKSPYAYLAKDPAYELEREYGIRVNWLPYTLNIPSYLGSATVDGQGRVLEETRNAHQWRRIRYSYMDCRRLANERGLVIRGPRKIFDSSIAHIGMLYAQRCGTFRPYHDAVFERFWKRELDIEDREAVRAVLAETGADADGFFDFLDGEGRRQLDGITAAAEEIGVFGVPTFVVDGELFWGGDRIHQVRQRLSRNG